MRRPPASSYFKLLSVSLLWCNFSGAFFSPLLLSCCVAREAADSMQGKQAWEESAPNSKKEGERGGGIDRESRFHQLLLFYFPNFPLSRRLSFERALVQFSHYITWNKFAAVICRFNCFFSSRSSKQQWKSSFISVQYNTASS